MDILSWKNRFEGLHAGLHRLPVQIRHAIGQKGLLRAGLRQRISLALFPRRFNTTRSLRPWCINLVPDFRCSYQCVYCSNEFVCHSIREGRLPRDWGQPMPPSLFETILQNVRHFKPVIGIIGGEPLIYPHFQPLLRAITEKGMHASMTTNGYALEDHAEFLMSQSLPLLGISYDGSESICDAITGCTGSWKRTVAGIESINRLKFDRRSRSPELKLIMTICSKNYHVIQETFNQMLELKPNLISVRHLLSTSQASIDRSPNDLFGSPCGLTVPFGGTDSISGFAGFDGKQIAEQLSWCARTAAHKRIRFAIEPGLSYSDTVSYYSSNSWVGKPRKCWVPWNILDILPNGDAVFCGLHFMYPLGNICRQPFDMLWNGESIRRLRSYLLEYSPFPVCERCCMTFMEL